MFFNSFAFIAFFLIVLTLLLTSRTVGKKACVRNVILLTASYWFYGSFNFGFTLILLFITIINYWGGSLLLHAIERKRKTIVTITTIISLLPLIFFKYSLFICRSISSLIDTEINTELLDGLLLPVGISFFTFQALSYTIDVYRKKITEQPTTINFALFVAFFPTILSGPIEKARELLPQINRWFLPSTTDFTQGVCIFIWGLFKKMVIADRLAIYVDWAYAIPSWLSGSTLALAAVFYSIQIYCDFSGYSDMALGVAKALGFNVTKNFRQPYFSRTFKDFWRKWHIALTSWFTEYVYFSLGGSHVRLKTHWIFNISTIFILSGIWHGAAWNFLIWGALHACFYLTEHFLGLQKKELRWNRLSSALSGIIVFILVTIAWIFFRVESLDSAIAIIGHIFTDSLGHLNVGSSSFSFAITLAMLTIFICYELMIRFRTLCFDVSGYSPALTKNIFSSVLLLLLIAMFGITSDHFVYFQF